MEIKDNIAVSKNGFIFDPASGESYSVNDIGADILTWMKSTSDIEQIKSKITEKYEVDEVSAEKDLHDFIAVLKQFELLKNDGIQ